MKKLLILLIPILLGCQEDEPANCEYALKQAEQIRKLSGSNMDQYNKEIIKLQANYPGCL